MPFSRSTLTQLKAQIAADIVAALPGSDPLLRFSNMGILGVALANMVNSLYGYLDWISLQAVPFTATGEFLEAWAALVGITREPATSAGGPTTATGTITFTGTNGLVFPANTPVTRGDGVEYTTGAAVTVSGGVAVVTATANPDLTGLTGAFGNCPIGTVMALGNSLAGIQATGSVSAAFIGGADLETDDSLRSRMLFQYANPPQGGDQRDYIEWALAVPGVTRAWCFPNAAGPGTVTVYTMFDSVESGSGGFPVGSNGVAAADTRATAATGDQLTVANAIFPLQPVTALVYSLAPTANPINFTITGIPSGSQSLVSPAIAGVFLNSGSPGGTIPLAYIWSVIATVTGVNDFLITSPTTDITNATGQLPTVGTITW